MQIYEFLNNNINSLANNRDYADSFDENYNFIKEYIRKKNCKIIAKTWNI